MSLVIEEPPFAVDVAWCSNTATVSISGEVDLATVAELDECLLYVVTKRPDHIVVDLAGLRFIDCSGAAVLGRAGRHCRLPGARCPSIHPIGWSVWCCD